MRFNRARACELIHKLAGAGARSQRPLTLPGCSCPRTGLAPSVSCRVSWWPMPVHVSSEIGRLRSVLVHPPGPELLAVTPTTREDYLYDDIIDHEEARREHRRFVAIVERF